jgi:ABC-type amino acid transport system permease subunit
MAPACERHPFRTWTVLWYYLFFWLAHLLWGLPPGQDHIHQVVFIVLSLAGLLVSAPEFFPRAASRQP